jgi:hypothetical protein
MPPPVKGERATDVSDGIRCYLRGPRRLRQEGDEAALDRLLTDIRRRQVDVVIVWSLDRLGRSLSHGDQQIDDNLLEVRRRIIPKFSQQIAREIRSMPPISRL